MSWKLEIDLAGHMPGELKASSVPYFLYKQDDWQTTVAVQVCQSSLLDVSTVQNRAVNRGSAASRVWRQGRAVSSGRVLH